MLDIWPPLPIVIRASGDEISGVVEGVDNIIAALKHNDRINAIDISNIPNPDLVPDLKFGDILDETKGPFPALTCLCLQFDSDWTALPDSFLGGFAPCLQTLTLERVSFPGLPTLLQSSTHLVRLVLQEIPFIGSISPEAMVTCLSVLTRLDELVLEFKFGCRQRLKSQRPAPQTRTLLPVLTKLRFGGLNEYLEDLVARVDAPILDNLEITFLNQRNFDNSQLTRFISCTEKFKTHDKVLVVFSYKAICITLQQTRDKALKFRISLRRWPKWRLLTLAQVFSSSFPLIPAVEHLYIIDNSINGAFRDSPDNTEWSEFFRPFTAVKDLYIPPAFMSCIAPALHVRDGVTGVLPALQTLYLEDPPEHTTDSWVDFAEVVTARQHAGHPITLSRWERKRRDWAARAG